MTAPNWTNRTLWTGDNLDIMRGMNSQSVDLIYLDPPFNSNRDYAAPVGSEAAGTAFKDTRTLDDVDLVCLFCLWSPDAERGGEGGRSRCRWPRHSYVKTFA